MAKTLIDAIRSRRRELGNPYAYIDEIADFEAVQASRRRLENPHAHAEEIDRMNTAVGRFDGLAMSTLERDQKTNWPKPRKHTEREIEQLARELQIRMWRAHKETDGNDPLDALDPFNALQRIGYQVKLVESLGAYIVGGRAIEVAGLISGKDKSVQISSQQLPHVQSFTAAHELGHALLHEGMELHRDRPLDGTHYSRERHEYEADKFATFFLMPKKLVVHTFEEIFGKAPFSLTEETVFALNRSSRRDGGANFASLRDLSMHLSSTGTYNGLQFVPLCKRFSVSNTAMAIRFEELQLIDFN